MKYAKPLFFLLAFTTVMACKNARAQAGKDTVFTFYFNTNAHQLSSTQQKDLERFLEKVQRIKTIHGFTDTTGTQQHNEVLSLWRALDIYNRLPKSRQAGVEVIANGETMTGKERWQNRRAELIASLTINEMAGSPEPVENISTDSITELNIEQLLFIPDQPELTEASLQYVQTLAKQLQQFAGAHFQIIGHVNYQSKLPPEQLKDMYELSEKRARVVYNQLVQYGIDAGRMTYKGVGNSQPVIPNPVNEAEKRKNMRVQVLIIRQ